MREFLWSEEMADACVYIMENTNFANLSESSYNEIRNTHQDFLQKIEDILISKSWHFKLKIVNPIYNI